MDSLNVGGRPCSLNKEKQSVKFRMRPGKGLKFRAMGRSVDLSLKEKVKEWIVYKFYDRFADHITCLQDTAAHLAYLDEMARLRRTDPEQFPPWESGNRGTAD